MKNNSVSDFYELLRKFFVEYLPITVSASSNTVVSYKTAFRLLLTYFDSKTDIKPCDITFSILDFDRLNSFFDWLINDRKNSRTTAKQRMGALASFADYAQNRNIDAATTFRTSLTKIEKKSFHRVKGKERSTFTRTELKILFSLPDTSTRMGFRDFVLLVVMYTSGARAQEICDLMVGHISYDEKGNAILTLTGKGDKSRRVKITDVASKILRKYICYRKIQTSFDSYVFPSQRNNKLSVVAIEEIYEKYISIAKKNHPDMFNNGPYTPHVMRHTTATHLIEAGVPLPIVKNILGHSSIQTTQIYLNISQETVDHSLEEWNKKWFSKEGLADTNLPQEGTTIPDFLK